MRSRLVAFDRQFSLTIFLGLFSALAVFWPGPAPAQSPRGDIDGDGRITPLDAVALVDHVLGAATLTGESRDKADQNIDGVVDIADVVQILHELPRLRSPVPGLVAPGEIVTIGAYGLDPEAETTVRFFAPGGYTVVTEALATSPDLVTALVPPLVDAGAVPVAGPISVELAQTLDGVTRVSNELAGMYIGELPVLAQAPGTITANLAGTLELILGDVLADLDLLDARSGGQVQTADLRGGVETLRAQFGSLKTQIRASIADPSLMPTIGMVSGTPVMLDQATLAAGDQLLLALIEGATFGPAGGSGGSAAASIGPDPCAMLRALGRELAGASGSEAAAHEAYKNLLRGQCLGQGFTDFGKSLLAFGGALGALGFFVPPPLGPAIALGGAAIVAGGLVTLSIAVVIQCSALAAASGQGGQNCVDAFNAFLTESIKALFSAIVGAIDQVTGVILFVYETLQSMLQSQLDRFAREFGDFLAMPTPTPSPTASPTPTPTPTATPTPTPEPTPPPDTWTGTFSGTLTVNDPCEIGCTAGIWNVSGAMMFTATPGISTGASAFGVTGEGTGAATVAQQPDCSGAGSTCTIENMPFAFGFGPNGSASGNTVTLTLIYEGTSTLVTGTRNGDTIAGSISISPEPGVTLQAGFTVTRR